MLKEFKAVKFFIIGSIGDGNHEYRDELSRLLSELGIEKNVIFTGYIEQIYDYYDLMDIVVHTSIEPEPSGRVIFEAMSQGKPVIASFLGGPKEFIDDNKDGFIVDPFDAQTLGDRMLRLLKNDELADSFGRIAKLKVDEKYNKHAYATIIEKIYSEVAGKP